MYSKSSAKAWRKYQNRYQLIGSKCANCKARYYPFREVCKKCFNNQMLSYHFKNQAKLISWSIIHTAPEGFEDSTPYVMAILELENDQRLTAQIVGIELDELKSGMLLNPTFRKILVDGEGGIIHYGLKFTN